MLAVWWAIYLKNVPKAWETAKYTDWPPPSYVLTGQTDQWNMEYLSSKLDILGLNTDVLKHKIWEGIK